jgi:hypothetical protein
VGAPRPPPRGRTRAEARAGAARRVPAERPRKV